MTHWLRHHPYTLAALLLTVAVALLSTGVRLLVIGCFLGWVLHSLVATIRDALREHPFPRREQ